MRPESLAVNVSVPNVLSLLLGTAVTIQETAQPVRAPHPEVARWTSEPISNQPSMVLDRTGDEEQPFRMAHNRDQLRNNGCLVQDYNFIDYWFGSADAPIMARHHLYADEVRVSLPPSRRPPTLVQAGAALSPKILCYLQKRSRGVQLLTKDGYRTIWRRPE